MGEFDMKRQLSTIEHYSQSYPQFCAMLVYNSKNVEKSAITRVINA